jgi:hypothetical protein
MRLEYEQHEEGGFKIALPICVGERILGGGSRWNIAFKSGGFFFCFFFFSSLEENNKIRVSCPPSNFIGICDSPIFLKYEA